MKDTHANFVLLYLPDIGGTKNIAQQFKKEKILIRRPFEEAYLKGWLLVCIGSLSDSKRFLDVLSNQLKLSIKL